MLLNPESGEDALWFGLPPAFVRFLLEENDDGDPAVAVVSRLNERLLLAERCLRDADSMSMAVSLEVRAPFTDHQFIEEAWKVPSAVRCAGTPNKAYEWDAFRPILPPDYAYRHKQGFDLPIRRWLHDGGFREVVRDTLADSSAATQAGIQPRYAGRIFNAHVEGYRSVHWSRVWSLFVLERWCQTNRVSA